MLSNKAASVLQKVWRHKWRFCLTRKLLKTLLVTHDINPTACAEASLAVLLEKLRNDKIKRQAGKVVRRLIWGYAEKGRRDGLLKLFDNKIYLSSVLIANKHDQILESLRPMREKKLFAASNTMLDSFQRIVYGLEKSLSLKKEITSTFFDNLESYFNCFEEWRVHDSFKLIRRMKVSLTTLYKNKAYLEQWTPGGDTGLIKEYDVQIEALREKLMRMSGGMVQLRAYDVQRLLVPEGPSRLSGLAPRFTNAEIMYELLLDPAWVNPGREEEQKAEHESWEMLLEDETKNLIDDILVNEDGGTTFQPSYFRLLEVIRKIKTAMIEMQWDRIQNVAEIERLLDIDLLEEELVNGSMDWTDIKKAVGCMASVLHMEPFNGTDAKDLIRYIQSCAKELDQTKRDKTLSTNREMVLILAKTQGVAILQERFNAQSSCLSKTKEWLANVTEEGPWETKHSYALTSLFATSPLVTKANFPETLYMDYERIERLHKEFNSLVMAHVLIVCIPPANEEAKRCVMECLDAESYDIEAIFTKANLNNIKSMVMQPDSFIYKTLSERFTRGLAARMTATMPAMMRIIPNGLPVHIERRTLALIKEACRLAEVNRQIYGKWYSGIQHG